MTSMSRSRRRFLASALCTLGAAGAGFASASTNPSRQRAGATRHALELMGNPYNETTYRRLATAFEQRPPYQSVNVSFTPRESDETVRALLLKAFTSTPLPDVAFLNGSVIRTFAERKLLAPLDALLDAEELNAWRTTRIGSSVYGVSFGLSVPVMVFNSQLVKRAGGDPSALPRDWLGVLALARRIKAAVPGTLGGFIEHDNSGAFAFLCLMESYGVKPMSADERHLTFNSPRGLQALHVLRGFGSSGQADADMSRRQARRAFADGRIGVLATMSSVIPYLQKNSTVHFQPLVTPLPLASAQATVPSAGPVAVLFTSDPERQQEVLRFIRFATSVEGQTLLANTSGYLPVRDLPPGFKAPRQLSSLVEPERVTSWYTFPGRNSLKISQLIQNEMQQIATLQTTPERAMDSLIRGIQPLLRRPA